MVIQDVSWKGDDMKKMIAIVLLLISSQSQARWSRFAHVTPENESKYGLEVKLTPVDGQKSKFSIKVKAVADDAKNAWLIVASEALSKEGQELRYYIWQSKKTEKDILVKAMLMPTKGAGESSARRRPKYYEVELDSKLMGRSYIYIDFPSPVTDGGYYCSIDLGSYLKKMTKGSANKELTETAPQKDSLAYKARAEKRKALWKDFHRAGFEKYGKVQDIMIYAEDDSLTRVCYISEDGLFVFRWGKSTGTIEKVTHAKMIKYDKINRITYEKRSPEALGTFSLWYYETKELSIGG